MEALLGPVVSSQLHPKCQSAVRTEALVVSLYGPIGGPPPAPMPLGKHLAASGIERQAVVVSQESLKPRRRVGTDAGQGAQAAMELCSLPPPVAQRFQIELAG